MTQEPCPKCHDTGIQHKAPYIMGLPDGDLYTMTACDCPAGKALLHKKETDHDRT